MINANSRNMKKREIISDLERASMMLLLLAGLALMLPSMAFAQREGPGGPPDVVFPAGYFSNPHHLLKIADKLELREEQKESIRELLRENREKVEELKADLRTQAQAFREVMTDFDSSEESVMAQLEALLELEAEMKQQRTVLMLGVRSLLDAEQWEKAKELFEARMQGRREGRRHGPGRPPHKGFPKR